MSLLSLAVLFVTVTILFAALELLIPALKPRKNAQFSWLRYLLFLAYPLTLCSLLLIWLGAKYSIIFVASVILGIVGEYLVGYRYHQVMGQRLWLYRKFAINGYTSWLTIPLWGFAGLLFAFLGVLLIGK